MKPWYVVVALGVLAVLGVVQASKASASTSSGSKYSDAELGTAPAVPGLAEREKAEPGFVRKFLSVLKETGANVDKLAALISEESGFNPQAGYAGGKAATGLMQWIPRYAKAISGFDVHELYRKSGLEQLDAVRTTILRAPGYRTDPPLQGWGNSIGAPDDHVLATKGDPETGEAYAVNAPYDADHKGHITAGDVRSKVYATLAIAKGRRIGPDGAIVGGAAS